MAIIQSYPINDNVKDTDLLLGVTNIAPSGNPIYQTKSFRVSDVRGSGGGGGSITIGTANGLSLQGSVLSLGLASSSANGALSSDNWTTFNNKQNALTGSGIVKSANGVISYIVDNSLNWNTAYNDKINSASVTGTTNKTLTLTQQDGGTVTASWVDDGGSITLTTNGTGGASTLINNVLNIPIYTGGGGVAWLESNATDLTIWNNGKGNRTTNTSFGDRALRSNIDGYQNTIYGYDAATSNTSGFENTAVGYQALYSGQSANRNIALGAKSLWSCVSGYGNTAIGNLSQYYNVSSYANVSIGDSSLLGVVNGEANTAIGLSAGQYAVGSSSRNVYIGLNAGPTSNVVENDKLYINNSFSTPLIGGDFATRTVSIDGSLTAKQFRLSALNTAPANATATGVLGEIRYDANFIYVCVANNTWKRSALTAW
jgi:hypothetical protein